MGSSDARIQGNGGNRQRLPPEDKSFSQKSLSQEKRLQTRFLLMTWLLVQVVGVRSYELEQGVEYGFSECVDNQRTMFFFTQQEQTCTDASVSKLMYHPPVHGLKCDVTCERGFYLGANFSGKTPVSGCERCPDGQYSLGGGKLFSKTTNSWTTPLPAELYTECVTRNLLTGEWQNNCDPWVAAKDGAYIASGANSNISTRFFASRLFSTLRLSATFVRNGSITFQFRVDAEEPYDGLVFEIDNQAKTKVISKTPHDEWKELTFPVTKGAHTFTWEFTKDYMGDAGQDRAFVKVIEMVGTAFADTSCHPCGQDLTMSGGSLCAVCGENQFAAKTSTSELDFQCYDCPRGTFAPKGSVGAASCIAQRACTTEDLVQVASECVAGERNISFAWSDPPTCLMDLPTSIKLPDPEVDVKCEGCEPGFYLNQHNRCATCAAGMFLDATISTANESTPVVGNDSSALPSSSAIVSEKNCKPCGKAEVVLRQFEMGQSSPSTQGWGNDWPSAFDEESARNAGWKITHEAIVHMGAALDQDSHVNDPKEYPLTFKMAFATSGFLNLTYQLANLPTFAQDKARAWLELQVDSQLVPLLHGGKNGTFSEIIPINVTSPTDDVEFQLVLRTTSAIAAKLADVRIKSMTFLGVAHGGGVGCAKCPNGFHPVTNDAGDEVTCQMCPAGTHAQVTHDGQVTCEPCPANFFSVEGSNDCRPCGNNTVSAPGSRMCAVPTLVKVDSTHITYNLSMLQAMVAGVEPEGTTSVTTPSKNQSSTPSLSDTIPTGSFHANRTFQVDLTDTYQFGLFRPLLEPKLPSSLPVVMDNLDVNVEKPYVLRLNVLNAAEAGGQFFQDTGRYGRVQCTIPADLEAFNGGSRMDINILKDGSGINVVYSEGSTCSNGVQATTELFLKCDLDASREKSAPQLVHWDEDKDCRLSLTWKTPYACPVCEKSNYREVRTVCSGGSRSIIYDLSTPCFGGFSPQEQEAVTCSDMVLDSNAVYQMYAAVSIVAFIVVVLLGSILIVHRKYKHAYREYMYLKGQMPQHTRPVNREDGEKDETTFEFTSENEAYLGNSPEGLQTTSRHFGEDNEESKADVRDDADSEDLERQQQQPQEKDDGFEKAGTIHSV